MHPARSTLFPYTTLFRSHNPTGGVAAPADEERLAELAQQHDLAVLSDEVYGRIRYEGNPSSIAALPGMARSEEHTSELQSLRHLVCRLLLEKKKVPDILQ